MRTLPPTACAAVIRRPAPGTFRPRRAAALACTAALATAALPQAHAGTAVTFNKGTSLNTASNYSTGGTANTSLPSNTSDVSLTTTSTALVFGSTTALSLESLNVSNGLAYTISNANTGNGNSSILLGNSAGFTDSYSNVANDLLYVANGSSLTFSGANTGGGTGVLGLALASSGNFDVAGSLTINSVISGSGLGFTKTGAGLLTLSGTNTFTGGVTLSAGTLNLGTVETTKNGGPLGIGGTITLGGGTLQYSTANAFDYSGRFSAASTAYNIDTNGRNVAFASALTGTNATLTKLGAGNLTLSGANTFTGTTTLSAGTLTLGASENAGISGPLGVGGAIVLNGGTLQYASVTNTAVTTFDYSGRFSTASTAYNIDTNGRAVTFASALTANNATLTKLGSGVLTLSGANTFGGTVTLSAGTLNLGVAEAGTSGPLGEGGAIVLNGGTLQYSTSNNTDYSARFSAASTAYTVSTNSRNVTFASPLAGAATLTKLGAGTLTLAGANTFTGAVTLTGDTVKVFTATVTDGNGAVTADPLGVGGAILFNGGTLQYSTNNNTDYSARFSAASTAYTIDTNSRNVTFASAFGGAATFTKLGAGILTLSGANTFTGAVTLNGGILSLAGTETPGTSGPLGMGGTISFGGGALQFTSTNTTDYSARFSSAAGQQYNIGTNGNNVTFASSLTSSGGTFTKQGNGTLILGGANTFTGAVAINGGALQAGAATVTDGTGAVTSDPLGVGGTISFGGGLLQYSANNATDYSGRFSNVDGQQYSIATNSQTVTFASSLTSNGGSFTKTSGPGTVILAGANTFNGGVNINGGVLQAGSAEGASAGPLGAAANASGAVNTISFKNGGTLQYSAANQFDYSSRFNNADAQTYSIDTNGQNVTLAANIGSGTSTFTKLGGGILTLTGNNGYGGGTTVSAGTLQVGNASGTSATGSGSVTVNSGATLQGAGFINAGANAITINGTLSPGAGTNAAGTITLASTASTGALTLAATSTLAFDINNTTTKDLVALDGTTVLTLGGGTLALTLPDTTATGIDYTATYALFTGVGSLTASSAFGTVTGYDTTDYTANLALNGTEYDLSFTPVPEPGTVWGCLLLVGALGWHQRRRVLHRA